MLLDQQELLPMRLAHFRAGVRRLGVRSIVFWPILAASASIIPPPETPDGYPQSCSLKRDAEGISQKRPLPQQLQQRAGLKGNFANSTNSSATRLPRAV